MRQPWYVTHAETIAQNVIGQAIYFCVMLAFGIPFKLSVPIQITGFVVSYARSYFIRRFFDWWHHRGMR